MLFNNIWKRLVNSWQVWWCWRRHSTSGRHPTAAHFAIFDSVFFIYL